MPAQNFVEVQPFAWHARSQLGMHSLTALSIRYNYKNELLFTVMAINNNYD